MKVAIVSTGEMGQGIAIALMRAGVEVRTCLAGRSARTRRFAAEGAIATADSLADLVSWADAFLSVVPPPEALIVARDVAKAKASSGAGAAMTYVDCNAVSPDTVRAVAATVGGAVVDAGIVGPAPHRSTRTRVYTSGPHARALRLPGLDVRPLDAPIGAASALKMCYAAMTKGTVALMLELLVAARALGVSDALGELIADAPQRRAAERTLPRAPTVARRYVGETEEIARTFSSVGLTPRIFEGVAELYAAVAATSLGAEHPESRDLARSADETATALAAELARPALEA